MWAGSDIVMALMWSGRAFAAKRSGTPLAWTYADALADFGAWGILNGAPHPKAAHAFLNFYLSSPEHAAAFSREMGYATPNLKCCRDADTGGEAGPHQYAGNLREDHSDGPALAGSQPRAGHGSLERLDFRLKTFRDDRTGQFRSCLAGPPILVGRGATHCGV